MTTRYSAFLVMLENPVRDDDAEDGVLIALRMIKGVLAVEPVESDVTEQITRTHVKRELLMKLIALVREDKV